MMHAQKFPISMYFLPIDHMSMNSELLAPGTSGFYLRTNERVPATIVGSSSKADGVAIQYDQCGPPSWLCLLNPSPDKSISVHAEFFVHITSLFYWS